MTLRSQSFPGSVRREFANLSVQASVERDGLGTPGGRKPGFAGELVEARPHSNAELHHRVAETVKIYPALRQGGSLEVRQHTLRNAGK